jgi:hypothetical protein
MPPASSQPTTSKTTSGAQPAGSAAKAPAAGASQRHLGAAINIWHVLAAFACMAASFLMLRTDGVPALRAMVSNDAYFNAGNPLLFDQRRGGYTVEVAREHLAALGNAANSYYADTYLVLYDLVFPILLLAFGVLLILYATNAAHARVMDVSPRVQRLMLAVPIALFVFDMGENACLYAMLEMYPTVNAKLVETASMFTQLKWFAAFIEGLLLTGLVVYLAHRHVEDARAAPKT